ncbi:uncharacterized protein LOC131293406 [Anopheles ziemanni]|uniref:uncharacterized protein LOC131264224 n=1 Tax=Anopheles coustani TaxID=139045 RepID=UPI0026583FE8|nr:uncharacterized protein LOC131264224 [Anopheles coustani]XP_058177467.1 uncharacterized protein LOC131293406 [Anopheles ziemanni]
MKVLIAVLSAIALASAQQQLIDQFFNGGLLPYNDWQPQTLPNPIFNGYGVAPLQQLLSGQQFPLVQQVPGVQVLPPVPVPFPAQYPYAVQQPGVQLPVPVPPYNAFQQPLQFQMVRHGLPHSDAAAVSYSSLHYNNNNNNNNPQQQTPAVNTVPTPSVPQLPSVGVNSATSVQVTPGAPSVTSDKVSVVKDIATFGTEYGTGSDKSPVARYEAINAGSVHVAPLPGHTVDQKLVAPGTVNQKV